MTIIIRKSIKAILFSRTVNKFAVRAGKSGIIQKLKPDYRFGWARLSLLLSASGIDPSMIKPAYELALKGHSKQFRRDNWTPYITHPVKVAAILLVDFNVRDPDIIQAALLHDTLEDTSINEEEILETTNRIVLRLVQIVTKGKTEDQEDYYTRIINCGEDDACKIKIADIITNTLEIWRERKQIPTSGTLSFDILGQPPFQKDLVLLEQYLRYLAQTETDPKRARKHTCEANLVRQCAKKFETQKQNIQSPFQ